MDKNGYKKSYRLCIQHWKFITMQTKKLKNIMSQVNVLICFKTVYHMIKYNNLL